jgi:hypothetical protein
MAELFLENQPFQVLDSPAKPEKNIRKKDINA